MSDYLLLELDRYGVAVRDRSEIAELHGSRRRARGRDAHATASGCRSRSCSCSSAPRRAPTGSATRSPATSNGFVLTGADAGAEGLLETSVPGIYAAGDVRAGSIKRCATAVGEGAMVVRFVHERLSGIAA